MFLFEVSEIEQELIGASDALIHDLAVGNSEYWDKSVFDPDGTVFDDSMLDAVAVTPVDGGSQSRYAGSVIWQVVLCGVAE